MKVSDVSVLLHSMLRILLWSLVTRSLKRVVWWKEIRFYISENPLAHQLPMLIVLRPESIDSKAAPENSQSLEFFLKLDHRISISRPNASHTSDEEKNSPRLKIREKDSSSPNSKFDALSVEGWKSGAQCQWWIFVTPPTCCSLNHRSRVDFLSARALLDRN